MSVLAASAIAAGIGALSSMATNAWNSYQTKKTNQYNESLMRESWNREDNAVQRRVADLKSAGLSPVLAAGSAADSSGPISTQAPKSNFNVDALQALSLASSLKHEQAETNLLNKQAENYGKPDWYVALKEIFGAEKFDQMLHTFGDKAYDWLMDLFGNGSSEGGVTYSFPDSSSVPSSPTVDSGLLPGEHGELKLIELPKDYDSKTPTPESQAKSYGLPQSLGSDAKEFLLQAMEEGHLNSNVLYGIANSLSKRYNVDRDSVLDLLFDLWDENHGTHY